MFMMKMDQSEEEEDGLLVDHFQLDQLLPMIHKYDTVTNLITGIERNDDNVSVILVTDFSCVNERKVMSNR